MGKYDEIMKLPHHVSKTRPQMSMKDRAAQFAPFAALTGYDAAIRETDRVLAERFTADGRDVQQAEDATPEISEELLFP